MTGCAPSEEEGASEYGEVNTVIPTKEIMTETVVEYSVPIPNSVPEDLAGSDPRFLQTVDVDLPTADESWTFVFAAPQLDMEDSAENATSEPAADAPETLLYGTWYLASIDGEPHSISRTPTVRFGRTGEFYATDGCNYIEEATYQVDQEQISLQGGVHTEKRCLGDDAAEIDSVASGLGSSRGFVFDIDNERVQTKNGRLIYTRNRP